MPDRLRHQQQLSGGLAIAMIPPMTRKARTMRTNTAITHFVLVSIRERMMHKAVGHQSPLSAPSTRTAGGDECG
jgi:hypothetical protein